MPLTAGGSIESFSDSESCDKRKLDVNRGNQVKLIIQWNPHISNACVRTFWDSTFDPSASVLSVASSVFTVSNISIAKSSIRLAMADNG